MNVTTTGLVRASAVLFAVAAALFAAGFVVADRATAGSDDVRVAVTDEVAPTTVAPTGDPGTAPTTTPGQDGTAQGTPVVVETRMVTVTAPPVTTTVAADPTIPATTDRTPVEPAPSTAPSTSTPAEPSVTPSEPDATEPPDVGSQGGTRPSP